MMGLLHPSGSLQALQLLAWTFPLVTLASFADDTLERVSKSEGYCSRILRAQGTRREGYNEFSLRVEGDPDFYKPGNSYRGESLHWVDQVPWIPKGQILRVRMESLLLTCIHMVHALGMLIEVNKKRSSFSSLF